MDHVVLVRRTGKIALSEMVSILLFVFILCFLNYAGHCNNLLCAYCEFLLGVAKRKECVIPWDLSNICYSWASRKQSHFSWQWELKKISMWDSFSIDTTMTLYLLPISAGIHTAFNELWSLSLQIWFPVCYWCFAAYSFFFFFLVRPGTVDKINL